MKAIRFDHHGGPEVMQVIEAPIPTPKPDELLIRMSWAGVSRPDKLMRTGTYPWTKEILPFYPGLYGAGTVAALGENVSGYHVGQSVYVEHPIACACYAEYKTAALPYVTPIPDGIDLQRASISNSHLILWGLLTECFPHSEGKTLYISGAAGAFGTALLQIAPLLGIQVIASASTPEKCDYLRQLNTGAYVFCYRNTNVKERVLALTGGKGADIIMDQSVGEQFCDQMEYLADMGTILIYNHTMGYPTQNVIQAMTNRFGNCPSIRVFSFHYFDDKPALLAQKKQEMFSLLAQGKIRPHVGGIFPLENAQQAHELLDSGAFFGSIVLDCR